jgi:hypothetical protein
MRFIPVFVGYHVIPSGWAMLDKHAYASYKRRRLREYLQFVGEFPLAS